MTNLKNGGLGILLSGKTTYCSWRELGRTCVQISSNHIKKPAWLCLPVILEIQWRQVDFQYSLSNQARWKHGLQIQWDTRVNKASWQAVREEGTQYGLHLCVHSHGILHTQYTHTQICYRNSIYLSISICIDTHANTKRAQLCILW